ncbi:DUF4244 domain-containing protein [Streptomyces sp. SBT349]|uniref:DUF4244 domain-containing protein n=1 Tax=Streptomyces sp. SBT349 TaxID=1580539 RepID=UPI00066D540F|nr:DUF4244 domain-containing protein [Streptomyces sp. SBT349]
MWTLSRPIARLPYRRPCRWQVSPWARRDNGMITAEWAVGLFAVVALGATLVSVVTSGAVSDALQETIEEALGTRP